MQDFAKVAKDQGAPLDYDRTEKLAALLSDNSDPDENRIAEIARLMGQTDDKPL
ncbi:hypothetical protein [Afipia sp. Root123D2]|uniref:hypothetical protein n=1 Tax=Afipia sp. Root123D2 TaxID=1736436 RepID=UPI001FCE0B45|nr:hypothetical protein [Afipia sp. Root123D2]